MKCFLLEPDKILTKNIVSCLNKYRLKIDIKVVQEEEDVFKEEPFLLEYAIFILNLKNPEDIGILNLIRDSGSRAPILLIIEKSVDVSLYKKIYYLSYDDILVKDFSPEEITFRIYKLCDVWNDNVFFLTKRRYFDYQHSVFIYDNEVIHLGVKEALLLKFLFVKSPHCVCFDDISYYVYQNEIISHERIRSLIRQIRTKLPICLIETVKGEGYMIKSIHGNFYTSKTKK